MVDAGDCQKQVPRNEVSRLLLGMLVGRNNGPCCEPEFHQLSASAIDQGLALDSGKGADIRIGTCVVHLGNDWRDRRTHNSFFVVAGSANDKNELASGQPLASISARDTAS